MLYEVITQGGCVHDHRIDTAGLGDEHRNRTVLRREYTIDAAGNLGRAGEGNTGNPAVGDEHGADRAVSGHEMHGGCRHAGGVQKLYRSYNFV